MTSQTDELKPCAWCRTSSPEYDNCDYGSGQWYSCRGCPVVIKVGYNEDLNAAWNTRVASPEIDRLKRQVAVLRVGLGFYASVMRYTGGNQRPNLGDPHQPKDLPYMLDVTRDNGSIARNTLAASDKIEKE